MTWCARCGSPLREGSDRCDACQAQESTASAPSQQPCAYCGATPTWAVVWTHEDAQETLWLCAACDRAEYAALASDDPDFAEQHLL